MNLMIVDTTDKALTVIVSTPERDYVSFSNDNIRHNATLMTHIDKILKESHLGIKDIDVFSAVVGPGSFTGIRIGVTVMNAFADVTKGKRVAVNVFEMISYNEKSAIALVDARHNNYYGAEIEDYKIIRMGDYKEADLDLNLTKKIYRKNIDYSKSLIEIVKEKIKDSNYIPQLAPLYLKDSQAEKELYKKIFSIQKMNNTHIDRVIEIERKLFSDTWNKHLWEETLTNDRAFSFVIEATGRVFGYISLLQVVDEMHIMKIAVIDEMKRQGYGDKLLNYAIDYSKSAGVKSITLEVRVSNIAAKSLYEKYGFKLLGTRKKYYEMKEDGDIYTLNL